MNICERERPADLSQVAGFADIVQRLEQLQECLGYSGQNFFIAGRSGVGKTTIARIIASQISDPICREEVDAQDVTVELLREWRDRCKIKPMWGDAYAFIINEVHGLSNRAVSMMQTILEESFVVRNSTWIMTTTDNGVQRLFDNKFDAFPLISRCLVLELNPTDQDLVAMADRLASIAKKYKLGNPSTFDCMGILKGCNYSMRAAMQSLAIGVAK